MEARESEGATMGKVYWVLNDKLGEGDPELGKLLMQKFIYNLARADQAPEKMIFMNDGIRLTSEGSEVLDDLKLLAEKGVAISTCGTCLDFHGLRDKLAVGVAGKMDGTVATTLAADDVVVLR
ncbi:MAG: sulfurtransferase-like selenium metabolism protein YedF [Coriobacteriales bacterium]|jgi:selenium metabolism protein YedF